ALHNLTLGKIHSMSSTTRSQRGNLRQRRAGGASKSVRVHPKLAVSMDLAASEIPKARLPPSMQHGMPSPLTLDREIDPSAAAPVGASAFLLVLMLGFPLNACNWFDFKN
ncbi:MAG TPA: hypothetical protein VE224_08330, partial [Pseudolabrys sp.]|nr:hypothetical protein [Pseudolabrys sp.]